ncbi:lysozyme inhibitor LprI family protein [uncultured Salinicola sp.]|uniref:lysozyme inhibitor LprI family protein n=1 Tax=uncultured Salinicola sp. TaxID=1193542 RepID=UPI0026309E8C|nr:lysozyme inhibitor LprI family protein [uncultured Salinicola sp.]|tara:strand:+ start:2010 stop:2423 length:414 start_codon:yes stop_codon:yes gene_type:complete
MLRIAFCLPLMITAFLIASPAAAQHMNDPTGPCRDTGSTVETVACLSLAYEKAVKELDAVQSRTLEHTDEITRTRLRKAHRAWLIYREAACTAEAAPYLGRTGETPARLACLEAATRERAAFLLAGLGWRVGKSIAD